MRQLVASCLGVALIACVESGPSDISPTLAVATATPVRIDLGTLGGFNSFATDINASGTVVGYAETPTLELHAFIWNAQSGMRDLGTLPGDYLSFAHAIDDAGNVVGSSTSTSGVTTAVMWRPGSPPQPLLDIQLPGVTGMTPLDLNNAGQVVGYGIDQNFELAGWFWSRQTGTVDLRQPIPSCQFGAAPSAIGPSGTVVGNYCEPAVGLMHAFVWSPGIPYQDLGVPLGRVNDAHIRAAGINSAGVIAGSAGPAAASFASLRPFIWRNTTFTPLAMFSRTDPHGYANGINDHGLVVGASKAARSGIIQAALWTSPSVIINLNGRDSSFSEAVAINNAGMIAGISRDSGGRNHATAWVPAP